MGLKLWISTNDNKLHHYSISKAKELMLLDHPISSVLIDKTISEVDTDAFLLWMNKSMRTGQIKLEHDFHLISDYAYVRHIQAKCDSINASIWKRPNKRFTLTQLPPEYQRACLDIYRRKGMDPFVIRDIINNRITAKMMQGAVSILVKNDILTPVPIMDDVYSEFIPNKFTFTASGAEELIALKGQIAKDSLTVVEPIPKKTKATKPKKPTVRKRVVEFINSIF